MKNITSKVKNRVSCQVRDRAKTSSQVWNQVERQVGIQVWDQVRIQVWSQVRGQVRLQVWEEAKKR